MHSVDPKKAHRLRDPRTNPCIKESDLATKCLEENHYVKEKCSAAFNNYNNCRSYWSNIMKKRRYANIKPDMPDEKERELIREEYKQGRNVISASKEG